MITWDDRKTLAELFQDYSPVPDEGTWEQFCEALIAVAQWGASRLQEDIEGEAENHHFSEAAGGYTECSCGWPNQEQYDAGEHEVVHVVKAAL